MNEYALVLGLLEYRNSLHIASFPKFATNKSLEADLCGNNKIGESEFTFSNNLAALLNTAVT